LRFPQTAGNFPSDVLPKHRPGGATDQDAEWQTAPAEREEGAKPVPWWKVRLRAGFTSGGLQQGRPMLVLLLLADVAARKFDPGISWSSVGKARAEQRKNPDINCTNPQMPTAHSFITGAVQEYTNKRTGRRDRSG
jgi:hypothetical protein